MQQKYPRVPAEVLIKDFDNIYGTLVEISQGSCPVSDINLETQGDQSQTLDGSSPDGFSFDLPLQQ